MTWGTYAQAHKGFAVFAGAGNDYQKDKQFKKLNAQKDKLEVKVIRDGEQTLVENTDIVVGDLLLLDTGDKIVADGVLAKGFNLVVDEAALTGESEPLNKGDQDVWCMSGSEVKIFAHALRHGACQNCFASQIQDCIVLGLPLPVWLPVAVMQSEL